MIEIDVVVVGGGFSGCAVAANLARHADAISSLALFEPDELGRGAAYGTPHREHLLNTRASQMSLYSDEPGHFVSWLGSRGGPDDFLPRQLYGEYVGDVAKQVFERPRFGYLRGRVSSVRSWSNGGFIVESSTGACFGARHVVLATGHLPPGDDFLPLDAITHHGYVADPWRFDYHAAKGDVLVIGAGLTALDVLVGLKAGGHRGMVHVLSRNGRFPQVHAQVAPYDVIPALDTQDARMLLRSLRLHIEAAARRGFDWRAVIDALRPEADVIWRRLSQAEQRRFERHLRTHWERHRHRAPQQADAVREEYVRSGRLRHYAGKLVQMHDGSATIALRDGKRVKLRPDWIVNCSGFRQAARMTRDPLLGSMLADGLVSRDAGGRGLRIGSDFGAIDRDGNRVQGLWIVGPPVRGSRFEATAVPELRGMAELAAREILRRLPKDVALLGA
jgi:uncharacterized NAD(P)/FAD-binding protein YdhS